MNDAEELAEFFFSLAERLPKYCAYSDPSLFPSFEDCCDGGQTERFETNQDNKKADRV